MRTSLNNVRDIEQFLLGEIPAEDIVVVKAKMIVNPVMRLQVATQKKLYKLVNLYGRRQLRNEIQTAEHQLFTSVEHTSFERQINQIFLKH
jgi:hypothetical protein